MSHLPLLKHDTQAIKNPPPTFQTVSRETVLKFVKDAQANTVSRRERTQRALFGGFAPSEIHDRGTLLPFSDSLSELDFSHLWTKGIEMPFTPMPRKR